VFKISFSRTDAFLRYTCGTTRSRNNFSRNVSAIPFCNSSR